MTWLCKNIVQALNLIEQLDLTNLMLLVYFIHYVKFRSTILHCLKCEAVNLQSHVRWYTHSFVKQIVHILFLLKGFTKCQKLHFLGHFVFFWPLVSSWKDQSNSAHNKMKSTFIWPPPITLHELCFETLIKDRRKSLKLYSLLTRRSNFLHLKLNLLLCYLL